MSLDSPEGNSLQRLLRASSELVGDFSADVNVELAPVVSEVLAESGLLLTEVLNSFGWVGQRFTRQVNVQALICRLKALVYDALELKGRGSYASVYKARNRLTGETVTLKKLKLPDIGEGIPAHALREVSLLAEMQHPNVVRFQDVLWDESRLIIVLEWLDVDLRQHIESGPEATSPENVKLYTFQILQGLEAVHGRRILHRDLKPQNVLVDCKTNTCKIADFGLARCFAPPVRAYTHEVVTRLYRPPEILLGSELYSTPVDIWSVGCILAELSTGDALFVGDSEIGQLFQIFQTMGTPEDSTWKGVHHLPYWQPNFPKWPAKDLQKVCPKLEPLGVDLLRQMLTYDPHQRITARNALEHPYFKDVQNLGTPSVSNCRPCSGVTSSSNGDTVMQAAPYPLPYPTGSPSLLTSEAMEPSPGGSFWQG